MCDFGKRYPGNFFSDRMRYHDHGGFFGYRTENKATMKARDLVHKPAEKADIRINSDRSWGIQLHMTTSARVYFGRALGGSAKPAWLGGCNNMDAVFCMR